MLYEPKIMVCNVQGLDGLACRLGVHSLVATTEASIVCIQETKLANLTPAIFMGSLDTNFDAYFCLSANDT
jgi:exonuclease III